MNQKTTAIARREPVGLSRGGGLQLRTFDDMQRFAKAVVESGLAPRALDTTAKVIVSLEYGAELGLKPMQSLQSIMVVNGQPKLYGDGLTAIINGSGELEDQKEWFEGEGDNLTAYCRVKRRGRESKQESFSVADAKRAKLWGKAGPWSQYPKRMLMWRARSWVLRDEFSDLLFGIGIAEEDYVSEKPRGESPAETVSLLEPEPVEPSHDDEVVDATSEIDGRVHTGDEVPEYPPEEPQDAPSEPETPQPGQTPPEPADEAEEPPREPQTERTPYQYWEDALIACETPEDVAKTLSKASADSQMGIVDKEQWGKLREVAKRVKSTMEA